MSVPVYTVDLTEADEAFAAYAAVRDAVRRDPGLLDNKYFCALQDTAYARFLMNFEAV